MTVVIKQQSLDFTPVFLFYTSSSVFFTTSETNLLLLHQTASAALQIIESRLLPEHRASPHVDVRCDELWDEVSFMC